MPLNDDAEVRILAQIAALKQDMERGHGNVEQYKRRLDELRRTVHETYAGGAGIGPRTLQLEASMSTPQPQGFWPQILDAVVRPFKAFASARVVTQILVVVVALFGLLVLTDGGRELIGGLLANTGGAVESVGEAIKGDSTEVLE